MKKLMIILLILLVTTMSVADIRQDDGNDWVKLWPRQKIEYIKGFILGNLSITAMLMDQEYPDIIFQEGTLDTFVLDLYNAFYSDPGNLDKPMFMIWYISVDAINEYIQDLAAKGPLKGVS